ncbi:MAG: CRISPR-associated protein Cas4 [Bacteroidales bacterium]
MKFTGTYFNYYYLCKRKLWLFANGICFEHTSDLVFEGKLIHENAYPQRSEKQEEIEIDGVKVDFYDANNKIIHEIKKSNKLEKAHEWQLKYYIYVFEKNGIEGVTGVLEYPNLRQKNQVLLTKEDSKQIQAMEIDILKIIENEHCPDLEKKGICKKCSYYEFCFVNELDILE